MNTYCMFKGTLVNAAPYLDRYHAKPHYIITLQGEDGHPFTVVVNSASDTTGADGTSQVYFLIDPHFSDPITAKLSPLANGLHIDGFPRLDYWQDHSLLDITRMRLVPDVDEDGRPFSVNDLINEALTIDVRQAPQSLPFDNGSTVQDRDFYTPADASVTVYGFGFLFQPKEDGLHETHMNQGNPRGPHSKENGAFQDGAVLVERGGNFTGIFTAFQTQCLPTDARGFPVPNAKSLPDFIGS